MFVTSDFGILMQDSFPLEEPLEALLGLQVKELFPFIGEGVGRANAS